MDFNGKTDGQIFEGIYTAVERRLAASGASPACSRDAFLAARNLGICDLDFAELSRLDNRSFMEAVCLAAWNRPPTPVEKKNWDADVGAMPPQDFQRKFAGWIAGKFKDSRPVQPSWGALLLAQVLNKAYTRVFLKMPGPFRDFVCNHFKKG